MLLSADVVAIESGSGEAMIGCAGSAIALSAEGVCTVPSGAVKVHVSDPEISAGLMRCPASKSRCPDFRGFAN